MQIEKDNDDQLIVYTGVQLHRGSLPAHVALAMVGGFVDALARIATPVSSVPTDPDAFVVRERDHARDALRALLHVVELDPFPARYDDAVRYARDALGR